MALPVRLPIIALLLAACTGNAFAQQYHFRVFSNGLQAESSLQEPPAVPATVAVGALSGAPDFGTVVVGDTVARSFVFTNTGNAAANNLYAWLSDYPDLAVVANSCGMVDSKRSVGFAAGANTCEVSLSYTPSSAASNLAGSTLTVEGEFTGSPQSLPLSGQGLPLTVTLAAAALPSGTTDVPYNSGTGYDLKPLLSTNSQETDAGLASWSVLSGSMPTGLSLSAQGVITGTPTGRNLGATVLVNARYKNSDGERSFTLVVNGVTLQATRIAKGRYSACAVSLTGTVYCWGQNQYGQLGTGGGSSSVPVPVANLGSGVTRISVSESNACAIKNGAAYCWGANTKGQLGDGTLVSRPTPVPVSGLSSGVTEISAGGLTTCAIQNGAAKCWGDNTLGATGSGSAVASSAVPLQVSGLTSDVTQISLREDSACAVHAGAAKCWGSNANGRLGIGTTGGSSATPVVVTGLSVGVTRVSAGQTLACAVVSGSAKCWGNGGIGGLGDNTNNSSTVPVSVLGLGSNVTEISVFQGLACAVQSGAAKCWGRNTSSQLGDGTSTNSLVPVQVAGLASGVSSIVSGDYSACAIHSGAVKCWGSNNWGTLGDGTTSIRATPVTVLR